MSLRLMRNAICKAKIKSKIVSGKDKTGMGVFVYYGVGSKMMWKISTIDECLVGWMD